MNITDSVLGKYWKLLHFSSMAVNLGRRGGSWGWKRNQRNWSRNSRRDSAKVQNWDVGTHKTVLAWKGTDSCLDDDTTSRSESRRWEHKKQPRRVPGRLKHGTGEGQEGREGGTLNYRWQKWAVPRRTALEAGKTLWDLPQGFISDPFGSEKPDFFLIFFFLMTPLKTTDSITYLALTTLKWRLADQF